MALFVKTIISRFCKHIPSESDYLMWVQIDKHLINTDENLTLGIVYVPPTQSRFYNDDELSKLENEIVSVCSLNKYVIISGDINARTKKLPDYLELDQYISDLFDYDDEIANFIDKTELLKNLNIPLARCSLDSSKTNTTGTWLTDVCKNNNLFIVNGRVGKDKGVGRRTFKDISMIDYTLCTADCFTFLKHFEVIELDSIFSDGHALLSWSLDVKHSTCDRQYPTPNLTNPRIKWSESKRDMFVSHIDMQDVQSLHETLDTLIPSNKSLDEISHTLAKIFNSAASRTFNSTKPQFFKRKFDKPWFGPACKIARKKYHRARQVYICNKTHKNKETLNSMSKQYKKTMNMFIYKHRKHKINTLRTLHTKNPKDYWKYIKSLEKNKDLSCPPLNSLYEHFRNINKSNQPHEHFETQDDPGSEILNKYISADEICKCIKTLKNGKCPGDDQILNEYIKSTQHIFLPLYVKLFNTVFDSGFIPSAWLEGIIRPIYKNKGDVKNVENFRPITILSCLGKLFTSMLNNRLTEFLDKNDSLSENQAGFRKGYGTTDHIFVLNSLIEIMQKSEKKLFCAFIDFSQAFDSIWRGGLWRKLLLRPVNGKFFKIVYNMYQNIKSCVRINNETSAFFPSECGVRQGENLSPLLFSLYLDDLENFIISGGVDSINLQIRSNEIQVYIKLLILLYADDTIIFSNDKRNFQKALDNFHEYCTIWKLKVNLTKTMLSYLIRGKIIRI